MIFLAACKDEVDPIDPIQPEENLAANYNNNVVTEWIQLYMDIEKIYQVSGLQLLLVPWLTSGCLLMGCAAGMPVFVSNDTKLSGLTVPDLPKDKLKYDWNIAVNAA